MFKKIAQYYVPAAIGHGFIRKLLITRDAHYETKKYNYETRQNDVTRTKMLTIDRVGLIAVGTIANIVYAPIYALKDLRTVEIDLRSLDRENDWLAKKPTDLLGFILA